MTRIRANFEFGTISDNPLSSSATTSNSTQYANLPVVASPDVLAITLDPKAVVGNPEIVYVTAHTASSTTITITRAQEGTTARSHNQNEVWVHALTAYDLSNTQPPTTSNVIDSATAGSGPAFALSDHLHGREGFATTSPSNLAPAAGATGASPNPAHHDHVHNAPTVTPTSQLASDVAAPGSNSIATGDHKHGREGYGSSVSVSAASDTLNPGVQTTVSRSDHQHGREGYGASASASAVGDAQAPGSANTLSRSDHKHGRESFGSAISNVTTNVSAAGGSASTPARSDHVHGHLTPTTTYGWMDGTTPSYGPTTQFATISGFGPPYTILTTTASGAVKIWAQATARLVAFGSAIADFYLAVGWGGAGASGSWGGATLGPPNSGGSNWHQLTSGLLDGDGGSGYTRTLGAPLDLYGLTPNTQYYFYLLWTTAPGSVAAQIVGSRGAANNGTFIKATQII